MIVCVCVVVSGGAVDMVGRVSGLTLLHPVCCGTDCSKSCHKHNSRCSVISVHTHTSSDKLRFIHNCVMSLWPPFCALKFLVIFLCSFSALVHLWWEDRMVSILLVSCVSADCVINRNGLLHTVFLFSRWESLVLVVMYTGYILIMKWVQEIYIMDHFSSQFGSFPIAVPPASSPLAYDRHQLGRVKANILPLRHVKSDKCIFIPTDVHALPKLCLKMPQWWYTFL